MVGFNTNICGMIMELELMVKKDTKMFIIMGFIYMFTSPHECGLCTRHINSLIAPGLCLAAVVKGPQFLQKNPPTEFSGYGPVVIACRTCFVPCLYLDFLVHFGNHSDIISRTTPAVTYQFSCLILL